MSEYDTPKPCPFCGNDDPIIDEIDTETSIVRCYNCLAEGPYYGDTDSTSPDDAVKLWNSRVA